MTKRPRICRPCSSPSLAGNRQHRLHRSSRRRSLVAHGRPANRDSRRRIRAFRFSRRRWRTCGARASGRTAVLAGCSRSLAASRSARLGGRLRRALVRRGAADTGARRAPGARRDDARCGDADVLDTGVRFVAVGVVLGLAGALSRHAADRHASLRRVAARSGEFRGRGCALLAGVGLLASYLPHAARAHRSDDGAAERVNRTPDRPWLARPIQPVPAPDRPDRATLKALIRPHPWKTSARLARLAVLALASAIARGFTGGSHASSHARPVQRHRSPRPSPRPNRAADAEAPDLAEDRIATADA